MIPEKCAHGSEEHWSGYVDETLSVSDRAAADQHLSVCNECRDVVAAIERVVARGRSASVSPPQSVIESIRREMTVHEASALARPPVNRRMRIPIAAVAALLAASVIVAIGLNQLPKFKTPNSTAASEVDPAATASLQRTLSTLDHAIAEAQSELVKHPDDSYLVEVVQQAKADKSHALESARAITERSR